MPTQYDYIADIDTSKIVERLKGINADAERTRVKMDTVFKAVGKEGVKAYADAERAAIKSTRTQIAEHQKVLRLTQQLNKSLSQQRGGGGGFFGGIGGQAGNTAAQIGVISGVVGGLTNAFIELGVKAVGSLINIGTESLTIAKNLETTGAVFKGIFQGNSEAAVAALERIRSTSRSLGVDLTELAQSFLPHVGSLDEFERIAKIAAALAKSQPEQGPVGARIALQEGLSGDLASLRRRFEIPKEAIKRIKEAQKEFGSSQGLIIGLEAELKRLGRDLENLGGTFDTQLGRVDQQFQEIKAGFAQPILEQLKLELGDVGDFLTENREEILLTAQALGAAVASIIEFVGNLLNIKEFDASTLVDFGNKVYSTVEAVELFVGAILRAIGASEGANIPVQVLSLAFNGLIFLITNLDKALITATQILGLATAGFEGLKAGIAPVIEEIGYLLEALVRFDVGDFAGAAEAIGKAVNRAKDGIIDTAGAQSAYTQSLLKTKDAIDEYNKALDKQEDKQNKLKKSLDGSNEALQTADDILKKRQSNDPLDLSDPTVLDNFRTAGKRNDDRMKGAKNRSKGNTADKLTASEEREKLERDNAEKILQIRIKGEREILEAFQQAKQEELDLIKKQGQEREKLERDIKRRRAENERKFRQELQDIDREFDISTEEATQKRDIAGFFDAIKKKEQEEQQAEIDRKRGREVIKLDAAERRQELKIQQEIELEDLKQSNKLKLEEMRRTLEANIVQEKAAQKRELANLKATEEAKTKVVQTEAAKRRQALSSQYGPPGTVIPTQPLASGEYIPGESYFARQMRLNGGKLQGLAKGGKIGPKGAIVGEEGPEYFIPGQQGNIMSHPDLIDSLKQLMYSPPTGSTGGNTYNDSSQVVLNIPPDKLTPGQVVEVRRIAASVNKEISKTPRAVGR